MASWHDLLLDGVDLTGRYGGRRGDSAVDAALVESAMGAQRDGVDWATWSGLATGQASKLGFLAGRDARKRPVNRHKRIRSAWDKAEEYRKRDLLRDATNRDRVAVVMVWIAEGCPGESGHPLLISPLGMKILYLAAVEGWNRQKVKVPLPRRRVARYLGVSEKRARIELARLHEMDVLRRADPGWYAENPAERRAALYRLPVTRAAQWIRLCGKVSYGPLSPYGPVDIGVWAPAPYGPTTGESDDDLERIAKKMGQINMSSDALIALMEWAAGRASSGDLPAEPPTDLPDNVLPIRREGPEAS